MYFRIISVFTVAICLQSGSPLDLAVSNLLKMQNGLGWPYKLHVAMGHEALLKIATSEENVQCEVTTPAGETFNVGSPPSNRYESWSDGCGVRVQNVSSHDEGRWRLTVTGNRNLTGWTEIYVEEDINVYSAPPVSLLDGQHAEVELTTLANSYCLVAQPFAESSLVSGHCRVTLERANRAVQGNWDVLVGIPGKVSELQVQVQVHVETERLDVGFIHDTSLNKLHIYCNVLNTVQNITFCRFQMASAPSGYTVMDGLSDGRHSYYGDGFAARHCGITIEQATTADYGSWRCSVGLQQWVGTQIVQQPAMQALVRVASSHITHIKRQLRVTIEPQTDVLVEQDASFTLMCNSDVSLSYCWFQHPNGSQYTPVVHDDPNQEFWYTGTSLQLGECGITFSKASLEDAGQWTCHMGPSDQLGVEMTDEVNLRITGPLAASVKEIQASVGGATTIYCRTANGNKPLHYCRFLSPNRVGISIDSTVTSENSILGRYYFTPERELNYGDCSLNIDPVTAEDFGEWTCAALVDGQIIEARDTITVQQLTGRSLAGIIGMSIGGAILLVLLVAIVLYRRGYIKLPFRSANASNSDLIVSASRPRRSNLSSSTTSSQDTDEFRAEISNRQNQNVYT